ncbi:MAG: permease [Deltaproteobacteria bacterium]|nr:permease [Deltaproteobacteria bacterium]
MEFLAQIWSVTTELAPWLLLGMLIAGVLHVALPADFVSRHLRGRGGVVAAVALGTPLPLCSCGVIPAAIGLRRDGASAGAVVGFLISTPQTGVDSILVSASMLGWPFALFKVASALTMGLVGGWLTGAAVSTEALSPAPEALSSSSQPRGLDALLSHALEILRSIWRWLVLGIAVSAAISTWVPAGSFAGFAQSSPVLSALTMLLIALPLYVCATASVPIAAALLTMGLSPGAALVFLMAGPASNLATVGAVYRALGGRVLAIYLGTIVVGSVSLSLLFDFVVPTASAARASAAAHHAHGAWWQLAAGALLGLMVAWFAAADLRAWLRGALRRSSANEQRELVVAGVNCGSCAKRLQSALYETQGVESADVRPDADQVGTGYAVVRGSIGDQQLREAIEAAGFSVRS